MKESRAATSTSTTTTTTTTLTSTSSSSNEPNTIQELRSNFERTLHSKIQGISARPDAAEVVTVQGKTAVFCGGSGLNTGGAGGPNSPNASGGGGGSGGASGSGGSPSSSGGDVRVVHIGPSSESELVLAYLCEGVYEALSQLMGGQTDRTMVLDNLELVFLLLDEHCDGGLILEVDGSKLACSVLLRDEEPNEFGQGGSTGSAMDGGMGMGGGGIGMVNGGVNPASRGGGLGGGDITLAQAFRQAKEQLIAGLNQNGM